MVSANLGSVILASGKEAVLTFDESGLLGVQVDGAVLQSELGDKAAMTNSGELRAGGGRGNAGITFLNWKSDTALVVSGVAHYRLTI